MNNMQQELYKIKSYSMRYNLFTEIVHHTTYKACKIISFYIIAIQNVQKILLKNIHQIRSIHFEFKLI